MLFHVLGFARRRLVVVAMAAVVFGCPAMLWAQGRAKPAMAPKPAAPKPAAPVPKKKTPTKDVPEAVDEEDFEYKMLPLNPELDEKGKDKKSAAEAKAKRSALDAKVHAVLGSGGSISDEETRKEVDGYYQRYVFARLTHPDGLTDWPAERKKFQKLLLPNTVPVEAHDHFVALAFQVMSVIAKGEYHPAARYNAAFFIAELNNQEALNSVDQKRAEVPYINSLKFMLDELASPQQIDAVRVACLRGILRHTKIDRQLVTERRLVNNNAETRIIAAALDLISKKDPPEGRTRGGHNWMRRRAVEILASLGAVGENGKVVTALDELVGNAAEPISLRCTAAESLGRLEYPARFNLDVGQTGKKFATLAAYACEAEIRRVEDERAREQKAREAATGMTGQFAPAGDTILGGVGNRKDPMAEFLAYRIELTIRRVVSQMTSIRKGLSPKSDQKSSLYLLAKGKDAEYLQKVVDGIDGVVNVTKSPSKEFATLLKQLQENVHELEKQCDVSVDVPDAEKPAEEEAAANPLDALAPDVGEPQNAGSKPAAGEAPTAPSAKPGEEPTDLEPADMTPPAETPPESKDGAAPPSDDGAVEDPLGEAKP